MPKYTSRTGKDVVIRFNGIIITVPAHGIYESKADDLADLFPLHVKKLEKDEVLQEVTHPLPPLNIRQVSPLSILPIIIPESPIEISLTLFNPPKTTSADKIFFNSLTPSECEAVEIPKIQSINEQKMIPFGDLPIKSFTFSENKPVEISEIYDTGPQKINDFSLPPPTELHSPIPTNITLKQEETTKNINKDVASDGPLDVREFLKMIESIITN